jgi:Uma2 family endonuclease
MAIGSKTRRRVTTRLGLRSSGLLMTPDEFDDLPDEALDHHLRYELINGVLIVTPPPDKGEIAPNEELGYLVRLHKNFHPQGSIIDESLSEQTIHATPKRRRADRAIWTGLGRVPDVEKDIPSIVVEFVSAKKRDYMRDYETKRAEYLGIGVREYWIIDRFQRIMTVYRNRPEGVATLIIKEAESYQTDLLPGFTLPIARLLARADDWTPKTRKKPRKPLEGGPR